MRHAHVPLGSSLAVLGAPDVVRDSSNEYVLVLPTDGDTSGTPEAMAGRGERRPMTTLQIAGGRVLTPDMTVIRGDVLVDQDTGRIRAVGEVDDGDTILDASGGLVLPGLINAHTHAAMTLLR
ncbi:MAG: hypothetical protein R3324_21745, partial [Halobacteriales archaeon]|nr:hypothetical protein [Halobacteriales archaeon]